MTSEFSWLPPEINSERIHAGAGPSSLFTAAVAWEGLAQDLRALAASFQSVVTGLADGAWAGPASALMAASAVPYVSWLAAAAEQADSAAAQARSAGAIFETTLLDTVHPAAVIANRVALVALVATNFLGQNASAIAANEGDYAEMWAQDVAAMVGYQVGATSVAAALTPFSVPPVDLAGLASQIGAQVVGVGSMVQGTLASVTSGAASAAQGLVAAAPALVSATESAVATAPIQSLSSAAQVVMYPASMMISPLMSLAQGANAGTAGLGAAATELGADVPKFVGDTALAAKGIGGGGGLGAGMSAGLGQARLVGAMSVPPTWQGSVPKGMASSAMQGLGSMANPAAMAQMAGTPSGMPMPMPMGMGGGAGGMPSGMMGRGGAGSHVVQSRPSVIPRVGVG